MQSVFPAVNELRRLIAQAGVTSTEQLARFVPCDRRTAAKLLRGRKQVYASTLQKLARKLGLGDDYESLVDWARTSDLTNSPSSNGQPESPSAVIDSTSVNGRRVQDFKVLLSAPRLSQKLITGRGSASFLECVQSSVTITTVDDWHKDHQLLPVPAYNHFFSAAAVITLPRVDGAHVLGYYRTPTPHLPHHIHTQGASILFSYSPQRNLDKHPRSPFDEWLHWCAVEPDRAEEILIGGRAPLLLRALQKKIDLQPYRSSISPLGVVTRDERSGKCLRVYTQYVFQVAISMRLKDIDRFVHSLRAPGLRISRVMSGTDERQLFIDHRKRANSQDIVVWRALRGTAASETYGGARFQRGFAVT